MKKSILISESEKQSILNMHSNPELKRKLFEQTTPQTSTELDPNGNPLDIVTITAKFPPADVRSEMEKEVAKMEQLQYELKETLKELENKKNQVGGKLLPRIKNWFKLSKLYRENSNLRLRIEQTEKDIEDYNNGKLLSDNEKNQLMAHIGQVIAIIGTFIIEKKTKLFSNIAKGINNSIN
jgi:hypothetical protein